jgi:eukaryotic-like serine/threonine-protein kinase
MTTAAPDPLVGLVLDEKYRIEARVGAGAMGAVYRARHLSLGALRAIKVMKAELAADPVFVERFQREARLVEGLRHPHLVALHDFARLPDGTWYIVSEFVEGETLASMLRRLGPISPPETTAILVQIIDGMVLAHGRGVVHRDISPDNIMIGQGDGGQRSAKLLDFGLAKDVVSPPADRTGSSVVLGKIGYASPEQMGSLAHGEEIDGRADVFSTTAVAYRMLTNDLPWRSDSLQSYVHDLLLRPESSLHEEIRRRAPQAWHGLLVRGLARDRALRTPSMVRLKSDMLEAAVGGGEDAEATHTTVTRAWRGTGTREPPRRERSWQRWRTVWLAAALGVAFVAAGAVLLRNPLTHPASRSPGTLVPSPPEPSPPPLASPTPTRIVPAHPTASPQPIVRDPASIRQDPEARRAPGREEAGAAPLEPTPEPARPDEPGAIVVYSTPEALVFLDGQPRGRTPTTLTQLPPGRHVLSLVTDDEQRFEEPVDVTAGGTVERRHRFPGFGSLAILSDVWVEVRVDDGPPQQTPAYVRRIGAGRHTVRASKPGYREQILDVTVEEGKTETLRIVLQRDQQSRSARPEGSELSAGGEP